jgi:DNA topoisomerase VI subunit B
MASTVATASLPRPGPVLQRTLFSTSRVMEFFTDKELRMQLGVERRSWAVALVKELMDNALDACEVAGVAPQITVTLTNDTLAVADNGAGLPQDALARSLDYLVRVSDKAFYITPTRGQLGNALKTVWAAPFVVSGTAGRIDVQTAAYALTVRVQLDRIAQQPVTTLTPMADGIVQKGRTGGKLRRDPISESCISLFHSALAIWLKNGP